MPQKTSLDETFGAYEDLPDLDTSKLIKKNFGGMPDKAEYEKVATEDVAEAPAAAAGYPRSIPLTNCGPYLTNYVSTTKYSRFTFLPLATIAQYKRAANVYLLFIAVLCCIPAISPLMPIAAVMPVVFVLTISLLREGAEDYARYKSDEDMNNKVSFSFKKRLKVVVSICAHMMHAWRMIIHFVLRRLPRDESLFFATRSIFFS